MGARASACCDEGNVNSVKGKWDQGWNPGTVGRGSRQEAGLVGN